MVRISLRAMSIWLVIAAIAGGVVHFVFGVSFWLGALLAVFSLIVNGLIIEWEDRKPGGWSE
jgi:hypothetical protein